MENIDLDAILSKYEPTYSAEHARIKGSPDHNLRKACEEAIHQTLVLASENAKVTAYDWEPDKRHYIDKQSILDVEKLIKY